MTREHLVGNARIALGPLFAAYSEWRRKGEDWRKEVERQFGSLTEKRQESDRMNATFEKMQWVGMFPIAACIALLADNIVRTYVREKLDADEGARSDFGREATPGIRFGKIFRVAANVGRHYDGEPLNQKLNEDVLGAFGVTPRDEQAAFLLLERSGIKTEEDLIREVDAILDDIDEAIRAAKAATESVER